MRKLVLFIFIFFVFDYTITLFLQNGLNQYYGLKSDAEIALIGHSHLMLGVDKEKMEKSLKLKVAKYTREGVNVADRDLMINQLLDQNKKTKIVIYSVDAWMFTGEGLSSNSFKLFYPFMDYDKVDDFVKSETTIIDFYQKKIIKTTRFNEMLISGSFRGYMKNWTNLKYGNVDTLQLKKNVANGNFRKINTTVNNIKIFESSIKRLIKNNIKVYLVYVPTISYYNNAEKDKFHETLLYFKKFADSNESIEYLEFIKDWENKHNYFFDPIHLNPQGQDAFTTILINSLKPKP